LLSDEDIRRQLDSQDWNCPVCKMKILPGANLAQYRGAVKGGGVSELLIHIPCAKIGKAPFVAVSKTE
jgi:hypothetical protein